MQENSLVVLNYVGSNTKMSNKLDFKTLKYGHGGA